MDATEAKLIDALVEGRCRDPLSILGPHREPDGRWTIRCFLPWAQQVEIGHQRAWQPMDPGTVAGLWMATLPSSKKPPRYRFRARRATGSTIIVQDPYRFSLQLDPEEISRFVRGEHRRASELLGAHVRTVDRVKGTLLAVWAPHAWSVNVLGTRNSWDGRCHPMRLHPESGVWELFVPGMGPGDLYKFSIQSARGHRGEKADPFGFAMELRPNTASVVSGPSTFEWRDEEWLASRPTAQAPNAPLSIYEVHLGSWKREEDGSWWSYRRLAEELVPYVADLGFTHLELMPITEHPYDGSWGYQTVGYFSPTSRFGTADDFRVFVDAAHRAGLGVLLDWVPAHFPRDGHGLVYFDGTHLFEHSDPRKGQHPDWGTFIYDYGRPQVRSFLLSSALFWLREFHLDGLRVDAVASMLYLDYSRDEGQWVPNRYGGRENLEAVDFLTQLNQEVHRHVPGALVCAEESTAWTGVTHDPPDGLGFDLKWNMGWMHDILKYMSTDPLMRSGQHETLSFSIHYAFSEAFLLPLSHDEVVHGKASLLAKMPGDSEQKPAQLRLLYGAMWAHPGKKLLFMGGEFGQWGEWDFEGSLEWPLLEHAPHQQLSAWVTALNRLYRNERALHERDHEWTGFEWIDFADDTQSVVSFLRRGSDPVETVVVVLSFTPVRRPDYRIGVPDPGRYRVILSSDHPRFGGEGGGSDAYETQPESWHGRDHVLRLELPPLGVLFLKADLAHDRGATD